MSNLKKCKYHCDYSDGENCRYKGDGDCIYIKGRRLTNTESIGMLFDDPPPYECITSFQNGIEIGDRIMEIGTD